MRRTPTRLAALALALAAATLLACGPVGGTVSGVADTHCGTAVTTTTELGCTSGAPPAAPVEEVTRYNAEADDDACKYHVKFSSTPVAADRDITFTVTLTDKSTGGPATGAATNIEAFLTELHPAPNSNMKTTEPTPGTYTIGPVRLDASGRWTVRFHFYEECSDIYEHSPHGHVGFYVDVP
jgi:hypothetical protein